MMRCRFAWVCMYACMYHICPYISRARIEPRAWIEVGGQGDNILIEAGSQIVPGSRIVAGFVRRCVQVASIVCVAWHKLYKWCQRESSTMFLSSWKQLNARRRRVRKLLCRRWAWTARGSVNGVSKRRRWLVWRRKEHLHASGSVEQEEGTRCEYGGCTVQLDTGNA